jgi:hypothetical protein
MGTMTYFVALAFRKTEDDGGDIVACDPKEARSSEQAIRMARSLARRRGIAEPSRLHGPATPLWATSRML